MVVAVVLIYAISSFIEIFSLVKAKKKKELIVFIILMSLSFILSLLLAFGVKIVSIERYFGNLVQWITGQ